MHDLRAKRTLVKSPPELWSELSEVDRLATHLDAFGEITITKLEPEHTVAWEGERASGTVSIEPSGWGTKVTLTAQLEAEAAEEEPPAEAAAVAEAVHDEPAVEELPVEAPPVMEVPVDDEPAEPVQDSPRRRRGFLGWLFRPRSSAQVVAPEPVVTPPEPAAEAPAVEEPEVAMEAEPEGAVEAVPEGAGDAEPEAPHGQAMLDPQHAQAVLDEVLDTLGSAHHRPFSRG